MPRLLAQHSNISQHIPLTLTIPSRTRYITSAGNFVCLYSAVWFHLLLLNNHGLAEAVKPTSYAPSMLLITFSVCSYHVGECYSIVEAHIFYSCWQFGNIAHFVYNCNYATAGATWKFQSLTSVLVCVCVMLKDHLKQFSLHNTKFVLHLLNNMCNFLWLVFHLPLKLQSSHLCYLYDVNQISSGLVRLDFFLPPWCI